MSRNLRHRLLAGVGAAMALAALPLLAFAQTEISARGWTHDQFGRLVFDRAARLITGAEIKDQKLIITFTEPVSIKLGGALDHLRTYLDGPLTAQGQRLELALTRPATLTRWEEDGKVIVDLRPVDAGAKTITTDAGTPSGAAAMAPTPSAEAPKAEAPKAEAPKAEVLKVEAPKVEAAKVEAAKPGAPEAEAPKARTLKAERPKPQPLVIQAPKVEAPQPEMPRIIKPGTGTTQPTVAAAGVVSPLKIISRHGDHGTFMRLAIDWPDRIGYRVSREGDRVEIAFTQPADIDLAPAQRDLPKELAQATAVNDQVARIRLTLAPGARLRDFRLGRTVVLDIMRPVKQEPASQTAEVPSSLPAAPEPAPPAPPAPTASGTIAQPPVAEAPAAPPPGQQPLQEIAAPPAPAEPEQAEAPQEFALQSLPAMPEAAPTPPASETPPASAEHPSDAQETAEPAPPMPAIEQATLPPRAPVDVQVRVVPAEDGAKVMFAWPEPVAAAAFRRNGALWLVFDMPSNDTKGLSDDARVAKLGKASKLDIPDVTIIRIVEAAPLGVSMTASGKSWVVDLSEGGKHAPRQTIEQRRETLTDGASSLLLRASNPGRVASVTDPAGGDLHIVPVRPPGLGIAEQASWPEFQLLESYQGVAIASTGDSVTVDSLPQGVVITTKPKDTPAPVAQEPGEGGTQVAAHEQEPAPQAQEAAEGGVPSVPGYFDLRTWRRGGEATFRSDQRGLQQAAINAGESDSASQRLALAEFYFAHGLIEEAKGALAQIGQEGRSQLDQRELALLTGAVQTLSGELDAARATLSDQALQGIPETNLFQGLLAARQGDWEKAAKHFGGPLPAIADYAKPIRQEIYLAAGTALSEAGNPIGARRFVDALLQDQPDRAARDRVTYLDGQIKLKAGERAQALALWAGLADSPVQEIKARSQFDLVEERLKAGELTPGDAIAPLEALRFVNRGGDFEFNLLRKLGTLYLQENQPRKGLLTLRSATVNFPNRPEAKDIGEQMSTAFRELYLDGGADRLPPLTAVALYDEFRELTPAGVTGDRMLSLLSDRLVKVDLLERAAELLETLAQKRLSGLDKAHAGIRLAAIRMLDQKPELALKALKESEVSEVLPPDMAAERKRLQARATFDTGDELGGMRLLQGDDSLEAKWLRADMQWRTREWPAAASALGELVAGEEQAMADERAALKEAMDPKKDPAASVRSAEAQEELKTKQEQHFKERVAPMLLNRAVALSLASDRRGLKALANEYGKRMEGTDQGKAFAMLTAPDNGLVESVSAEMASVARIDAFVTDYRERLKKVSLSDEANQGGS